MIPRLEDVARGDLRRRCESAVRGGARMQMAYAWFPDRGTSPEIRYLVHCGADQPMQIWRCRPGTETLPSLSAIAPLLSWYEREMTDLCGVSFADHPQPDPLVLLPGATAPTPPLRPDATAPLNYTPRASDALPEIAGPMSDDVQLLPFGPVRADVLESAQFHFYYIGEGILHYHPQLFFKHRGMEKRFEGLSPALGVVLAERVSAIGGVAHALAYCRALESASGCEVPRRAQWLRVLLAELERLYNHLHYLGHLCHTTTLKVGEAQGKYLEELAKQLNARASGSRLLRSLLTPGGLRREPRLDGLIEALNALQTQFLPYAAMLEASTTHLDRLITTGMLSPKLAFDQGATGPIERASGLDRDPRRDQAYSAYPDLPLKVAVRQAGDAHARQQVRIDEINHSIELIRALLCDLPGGPTRAPCEAPAGAEGLGWAESPRGSLYYSVHIDAGGRLGRVKIKSPSFSNWRAFAFTVHDSNMMDYAINEASFGLSIAGCDR
jgi:Ni,Fe-hydrogenase III large subunit